ncbi:MAG: choice-of-anchor D domain-containing protein [Deltaproteobacteria bacterium]|nr:choice-of-anchor D domain-containing protein [Deltaproteobacteria bacterium]
MKRYLWIGLLAGLAACAGDGPPRPGLSQGDGGSDDGGGSGADGGSAGDPCGSTDDCPEGLLCDPFGGTCVECLQDRHCPEGAVCQDRACVLPGSVCVPGRVTCLDGPAARVCNGDGDGYLPDEPCDDGVLCTLDGCVEGEGCTAAPDATVCDDDNACTLDTCHPVAGCDHSWDPACGEAPLADATPKKLDFGLLLPGEHRDMALTITNLGLGPLVVSDLSIAGGTNAFLLVTQDGEVTSVTPAPPIEIAPGGQASLTLRFRPPAVGEYSADLLVHCNDPTLPLGDLVVALAGESVDTNCIEALPSALDFGPVAVGTLAVMDVTLSNCGQGLVPVYDIHLAGGGGAFSLESTVGTPMDLDVGEFVVLQVGYYPSAVGVTDQGSLVVDNGAPSDPHLNVPLTGAGVKAPCPVAVIQSPAGGVAAPLAEVQLIGGNSYAPQGEVTDWQWTLLQAPEGAVTAFSPHQLLDNPKLWVPLVGTYQVGLNVWSDGGIQSCETATYDLQVTPSQLLYVELSWDTPGDPDPTDGAGTDLDLHVLNPQADGPDHDGDGQPDGWYDAPWDCFWGNLHPTVWGSMDPGVDDDPDMLREDANGAGPEVVAFTAPQEGTTYRIGVVYWQAQGLGSSAARVRIYSGNGTPVLDAGPVTLVQGDLWKVGTVTFNGGIPVVVVPPTAKIVPNYPKPIGG